MLSPVWLAVLVGTSVATVGGVVLFFRRHEMGWRMVVEDPAQHFHLPPFAGLFTYAGAMAMVVAATVCLFTRGLRPLAGGRESATLGLAGALSAMLAIDDLLVLHEVVLRQALGLSELVVFGVYAAVGAAILWCIGPEVLGRRYSGLWLSIAFLAAMVVADKVETVRGVTNLQLLTEETAKFCGFVLWAAFWLAYCRAALRRA